jgi:hypothetical protein
MSFRGYRVDELQCACSGTLERNRFATITKATNTAAYAGAGDEVDGVITARSANSKVSVYPVSSKKRTFLIKLLSNVSRGDALFPAPNGQAVTSSYNVIRGVTALPTPSADAVYLLPAEPTGTGWTDHGNAVAIYTHSETSWAYVDVGADKNVGLTVHVSEEGKYYTWNGEAWVLAKVAAYANEAGVVGDEIEAYRSKDLDRVNSDMLPANCNFGIALMGASTAESDANAEVVVLDNRIAAGDIAIVTIANQTGQEGAGDTLTPVYVVKAVCTAGTLTVTLSGNGGAGTVINYIIVRSL